MGKRKGVNNHGSQAGQQSQTEFYKVLGNYKSLKIVNDDISDKIKSIYDNNIWDLKEKFIDLKDYYKDIGISQEIAWENDIMYLDLDNEIEHSKVEILGLMQLIIRANQIQ